MLYTHLLCMSLGVTLLMVTLQIKCYRIHGLLEFCIVYEFRTMVSYAGEREGICFTKGDSLTLKWRIWKHGVEFPFNFKTIVRISGDFKATTNWVGSFHHSISCDLSVQDRASKFVVLGENTFTPNSGFKYASMNHLPHHTTLTLSKGVSHHENCFMSYHCSANVMLESRSGVRLFRITLTGLRDEAYHDISCSRRGLLYQD